LGSYTIGNLSYDFRIQGQLEEARKLLELPVNTPAGIRITLGDIAQLQRKEKNKTEELL